MDLRTLSPHCQYAGRNLPACVQVDVCLRLLKTRQVTCDSSLQTKMQRGAQPHAAQPQCMEHTLETEPHRGPNAKCTDNAAWPTQPLTLSKPQDDDAWLPLPHRQAPARRASAALAHAPAPAASARGQRQRAAAQQQVAPREAQRKHWRGLGGQRAQRSRPCTGRRRRRGRAVRRRRPGSGPRRGAPQLDRVVGAACRMTG